MFDFTSLVENFMPPLLDELQSNSVGLESDEAECLFLSSISVRLTGKSELIHVTRKSEQISDKNIQGYLVVDLTLAVISLLC